MSPVPSSPRRVSPPPPAPVGCSPCKRHQGITPALLSRRTAVPTSQGLSLLHFRATQATRGQKDPRAPKDPM